MLKQWYTIETQDQGYNVKCKDIKAVKAAIKAAARLNIYIDELIVSEYELDKTCEDNKAIIDFCNAEVFILDY